jgi:hypothetical protein
MGASLVCLQCSGVVPDVVVEPPDPSWSVLGATDIRAAMWQFHESGMNVG